MNGAHTRDAPLVPDGLPWLAHTPYWMHFDPAERLRANQLMGLLINELCLAVEETLIAVGLRPAIAALEAEGESTLAARLTAMLAEERRHSGWFSGFNHAYAPNLYGSDGFRYVAAPRWARGLGRLSAHVPGAWCACAWLVLATEDWACAFASQLDRAAAGGAPIDTAYLALHRAHLREEREHVTIDAMVVAFAQRRVVPALRRPLVVAAHRLVHAAMRPRRAAPRMLSDFVDEFPRWRAELPGMTRAVLRVGRTAAYWRSPMVALRLDATAACAGRWGASWTGVDDD